MSTEIDRLEVLFTANFKDLDAKMSKFLSNQRAAKKTVEDTWKSTPVGAIFNDLTKSAEEATNEIPLLGNALKALGPVGIAAAVGIGLIVGALEAVKKAAEAGDEVYKAAAKIGVSTDMLQEFQHALTVAGGDATAAAGGIQAFEAQLGQAALGMPKALRAFQSLKLDPKAMVGDTDAALTAVIDKLSQVSSVAERIGLAKKLGLEELIPLTNLSAEALAEMRKQAEATGQVLSKETVDAAHETTVQFDEMQKQIKNELTTALVTLAPELLTVASSLVTVAEKVKDLAEAFKLGLAEIKGWWAIIGDILHESGIAAFGDAIAGMLNKANAAVAGLQPNKAGLDLGTGIGKAFQAAAERGRPSELEGADQYAAELRAERERDRLKATTGGVTPGSLAKPKTVTPPKDETVAFDKSAMDAYDTSVKELTAAQLALATNLEERVRFEKQAVDDDTQKKLDGLNAEEAKIQAALNDAKKKTIDAHSAEQIARLEMAKIAVEQTAVDRKILIDRQAEAERLDQRLNAEQAQASLQAEALNAQRDHLTAIAALVNTAALRNSAEIEAQAKQQEAERVLADSTLKLAQERLDAAAAIDPRSRETAAARIAVTAAQQARDELGTRQTDTQAVLAKSQRGPVQVYMDSLESLNTVMSEAGVAAAKSLADGLADALVNAKNLGDVVKNVFRQLVTQIASAAIQKNITGPILAALGLPGHAAGTMSSASGWALVGENGPEAIRLPGNSQVIPNSALRNVGLQGGGGGGGTVIHFDNRGAIIWEEAARQMMSYADQAAAKSGAGAVQVARRATSSDLSGQASRRLG